MPVTRDDFSSAVIDDLSVSDSLFPKNCVRHSINMMFDRPRGAIQQRSGTTCVGSGAASAGNTINGLFNLRSSTLAKSQLLVAATTQIIYLNAGTWTTTVSGLTTGLKTRFFTFLDRVAFLNGADQPQAWSGAGAWETSGGPLDIANMPKVKYADVLNLRVYGFTGSTLSWSSIASGGAISWTSGNSSVEVYPHDGTGEGTSLIGNGRMLLIFKERALYRYDGSDLQRISFVGTPSHESVFNDDMGVTYFFGQGANSVGFYMTTGGYPAKISRTIQKWVEAIDPAYYQHIFGYTDGQKACWSIGSVTIDGSTYSNAWVVYNISDKTWEMYNYADRFRCGGMYIDPVSNAITVVGGDTDGFVQTIGAGNTDGIVGVTPGAPIAIEVDFGDDAFGDRGMLKAIPSFFALSSNVTDMKVLAKEDDKKFKDMGNITKRETLFSQKLQFRRLTLKIVGSNSSTPCSFEGFEFVEVQNLGYGGL